jgi:hypothetical protein
MSEADKHKAHIFYVDSRFERLARRSGGVPRERALAAAQGQIDAIRPAFGEWLDQELNDLSVAAADAESLPTSMSAVERVEVICGQIRDLGATMGHSLVTFVAGSLCTILEAVKEGASYDAEAVSCHISALRLVRTEPYRHMEAEQVPEMMAGLRRIVELTKKGSDRKES